MGKANKTNVMRVLDSKKIAYEPFLFEADGSMTGVEIAGILGEPTEKVYKTLVTVGASKLNYVFVIPVEKELDLKKAAKAAGEKSIAMIKSKELLPLTGYIHGGCSPIGMKKEFKTFINDTVNEISDIYFSGGKIGCQVHLSTEDLDKCIRFETADVVVTSC